MTLITNVKGYINGDDRGVFEEHLLTYEEIISNGRYYKPTELIEILNANEDYYYNMLNGGGHLSHKDADDCTVSGGSSVVGILKSNGMFYTVSYGGASSVAYKPNNEQGSRRATAGISC